MNTLRINKEFPALKYVIAVLALYFLLIEFSGISDFKIFLFASENLTKGKDIYKVPFLPDQLYYYYSPLFALLLYPFTLLPHDLVGWIWKLLNFFFLFRLWYSITWFLNFTSFSKKQKNIFTVLSFVAVHFLVYRNIHNHQMTIMILFFALEGIRQIVKKNYLAGSLLLALGINFKILPLVFIPYLIYRQWYLPVGYIIIFLLLLFLLPAAFLGMEQNVFLHESWLSTINPFSKEMNIDVEERGFHSLTTLIPTLFYQNTGDTSGVTLTRNIADLPLKTVILITNLLRLVFIVFTLFFLRTLPFKKAFSKEHILLEVSYILMIIPLIFPRQQTYAFFMIFPAVTVIVYYFLFKVNMDSLRKKALLGLFILGSIVINLEFLIGHFRNYYWHFKTLTWGTLFIVLVYFVVSQLWLSNLIKHRKVR